MFSAHEMTSTIYLNYRLYSFTNLLLHVKYSPSVIMLIAHLLVCKVEKEGRSLSIDILFTIRELRTLICGQSDTIHYKQIRVLSKLILLFVKKSNKRLITPTW